MRAILHCINLHNRSLVWSRGENGVNIARFLSPKRLDRDLFTNYAGFVSNKGFALPGRFSLADKNSVSDRAYVDVLRGN